ncbi:mitochondrial peptide methionine sulfoxide reductase isoform 3-T3 [Synchiropus picturatus]
MEGNIHDHDGADQCDCMRPRSCQHGLGQTDGRTDRQTEGADGNVIEVRGGWVDGWYEGLTGHTEVVRVVFPPKDISLEELLKRFWENHDPTQGMRQQMDTGTQYRSAIYTSSPDQQKLALKSKLAFQQELDKKGYGAITTEIREGQQFYYAEDRHQQYLKKVPKGSCNPKGTGAYLSDSWNDGV